MKHSFLDKQNNKLSQIFLNVKRDLQKSALEKELLESLLYIKNIGILGHASNISILSLLEELSDFSTKLKPAYISMTHYLQINDKKTAGRILGDLVNTSYAYDIGKFLSEWEDLSPDDLLSTIDSYVSMLREERLTRERNRDELISDLLYFPVILNCMAVLLNFIYIGYFLEQKELLQLFF